MTLDFWQNTVIYEKKIFPIGMPSCDALNVPADIIAKMNEQCEKINLIIFFSLKKSRTMPTSFEMT